MRSTLTALSAGSCGLSAAEISAPSPLPNPFFCTAALLCVDHDFLGEREIILRAARVDVVEQRRLPVARALAQAHVARDDGVKQQLGKMLADLVGDLVREVVPDIEHREQDAFEMEAGVQLALDELDRLEERREPFERVVLALQRHEDGIGRGERVQREQAERRRTVEQYEIEFLLYALKNFSQARFALFERDQLDLGAGQIARRRRDEKERQLGLPQNVRQRRLADQRMIKTLPGAAGALKAETRRAVPLRVDIDQERALFRDRKRGGEINGGGRLADAALLIGDGDDLSHYRVKSATYDSNANGQSFITGEENLEEKNVSRETNPHPTLSLTKGEGKGEGYNSSRTARDYRP